MQTAASHFSNPAGMIPLEDLGLLQTRYQNLSISARAGAVLKDAEPALVAAERILHKLSEHKATSKAIGKLASDSPLIARMRSCEARGVLMDNKADFIHTTHNKIASWRKTMLRVSQGEGVAVSSSGKEYIPSSDPVALAVYGISHLGQYLSITQLIISEISKLEKEVLEWSSAGAEMRRCATVITDYEFAAGLTSQVH